MPSFVSKNGIWEPAKERVATVVDGQPQIYEGPDREAVKYIEEEGGVVGQDASQDPQVLQASRNMGFNSVQEYLAHFQPTPKQVEEIKIAQEKPITHAAEKSKPGVTGGTKGGFNKDDETPLGAMEKKN